MGTTSILNLYFSVCSLPFLLFKGSVLSFLLSVLIPFCFCYPGWFPNTQGWYPEVKPLHDKFSDNILNEWKPTRHRFCEELKHVWNMLQEGLNELYFVVQNL
jgi:hypothetical protein